MRTSVAPLLGSRPLGGACRPPSKAITGERSSAACSVLPCPRRTEARSRAGSELRRLPLVERRLRLGLLWMQSRGAVEHSLRHIPQAVLAHAEPHDARGEPDGAD